GETALFSGGVFSMMPVGIGNGASRPSRAMARPDASGDDVVALPEVSGTAVAGTYGTTSALGSAKFGSPVISAGALAVGGAAGMKTFTPGRDLAVGGGHGGPDESALSANAADAPAKINPPAISTLCRLAMFALLPSGVVSIAPSFLRLPVFRILSLMWD